MPKQKLSPERWKQAKQEYESNEDITFDDISDKYGITKSTVAYHAHGDEWAIRSRWPGTPANHTHGMSTTPEYHTYKSIMRRCYDTECKDYEGYGGRGIQVCDHWRKSFENFYRDMGKRPGKLYSIERIENGKNYEPGNCRWATMQEQSNNRRSNTFYIVEDERLTLAQLARKYNQDYKALWARLDRYKDINRALGLK